jgi:hypothetical protein
MQIVVRLYSVNSKYRSMCLFYFHRLIKIPPGDNYKESNSIIFRNLQLGNSKLKNLQTGNLKTGIYRNFYKSQFKQ